MLEDLKGLFRGNNFIGQIILINAAAFLVVNLLTSIVFGGNEAWMYNTLAIPADPSQLLWRPWTILTYMFMHGGFGHIFWNMILLFWFGRIFKDFMGQERLVGLYFLGGFAGAALYILFYMLMYLLGTGTDQIEVTYMVGASAAVMAVIIAAGSKFPDYTISLLLVGPVKLRYLALFIFVTSTLIDIMSNLGGHIAHIGGAVVGFLYIRNLDKGKDWAMSFYNFFDRTRKSLSGQRNPRMKVVRDKKAKSSSKGPSVSFGKSKNTAPTSGVSDAEAQARLDAILDKISKSGYDNLTKDEKDFLFKMSDKKS